MSFPTLQVRPNEKNPKVLRSHEFLRQSTLLVERNMINAEGRRMLAKMLTKVVAEVKGIYALDEKRAELAKSGKLVDKLKTAYQTSVGVMEDRFVLADLARQVQEKKLEVQRNYYECDHLRKSVQSTNAEIRREREMNEKRLAFSNKATAELTNKSTSILKLLENSTDVCKLRKMEDEKKIIVEEVDALREEKRTLADDIRSKKATLKAESKKSFQKTVIECAKHYKLCQSLTPKLLKSKKNLEVLKDEEESRRACGSLDETMQFDRSFVLASMDRDKSMEKELEKEPAKPATPQKLSSRSTSFNDSSIVEQHTIEVEDDPIQEENGDVEMVPVFVEQPVVAPLQSLKRKESMMETQRVLPRDPSPEPEEEPQEVDEQADRSLDVMELDQEEQDEDGVELMEQEEQEEQEENPMIFETQKQSEPVPVVSSASQTFKKPSPKKETSPAALDISNNGDNVHNDTVMRIDEEEVLSENGSNRSNNFSFNFFGNAKSGIGADGNASGIDTDNNFDFNFGGIGAGDDGSSNGSGGTFDFLNCGGEDDGQGSSSNPASDPFGFGSSTGGTGGGDMSFNFNFDGDNDGGAGTGGNGTSFFNF